MDMLFLKLLNMSISATWLILAVFILRLLLKRAGGKIRTLLWVLVAVSLLSPFSIESGFSLLPSAEPIPQNIVYDAKPGIDSGFEVLDEAVKPMLQNSLSPTEGYSINPVQVYIIVGFWLWLAGITVLLAYALVSYFVLKRRTNASVNLFDNVYVCDEINSSFVLGFVKPKIYLESSIDDEHREYVIRHEQAHIKRGDNFVKVFGFMVLALHWFNPLVWISYGLFCRDMELACDEEVIGQMNSIEKKKYSQALLSCAFHSKAAFVCPVAFGEISVKTRIKAVLKYKKAPLWLGVLALAICLAAALLLMTDPVQPKPFEPEDVYKLVRAEVMGEYVQERENSLKAIEEKLSNAKKMTVEPACEFSMKIYLQRADGTVGFVEPAMDGCEIFRCGEEYYEYGINKSESVLALVGFEPFNQKEEFDAQGRLIKQTAYNYFEPFAIVEYSYEGDKIVSQTHRDGEGGIQGVEKLEYDEQGRNSFTHFYTPNVYGELQLQHSMETVFDEQGNYKETRMYRADGSLIESIGVTEPGMISLDAHGNPIE